MSRTGLLWLRNDLRISDNPALVEAMRECDAVRAIYVIETDKKLRPIGAAARAWLEVSLSHLAAALAELGVMLEVTEGKSADHIPNAIKAHGVGAVFWNRRYGPADRAHDEAIKSALEGRDVSVTSCNASLLVEPWTIANKAGAPYAVYTPFFRELRQRDIAQPQRAPARRDPVKPPTLKFAPQPAWATKVLDHWQPGEEAAKRTLHKFIDARLIHYPKGRDIPGVDHTSRLSPYLRHGEIGPRQIWHAVLHAMADDHTLHDAGEKFLAELGWRDFNHNSLFHREDIAEVPMQAKFAEMEWRTDAKGLEAWQQGQTGIPIVDAGMRQLWETGWMHNRVRMIVASLLVKNMLIDWRLGEQWFWDTLVDADAANNPGNWQWVAGSGADAAPFFRIFNPVTQGSRFDPHGDYLRRWVPELAALPDAAIHEPGTAAPEALKQAGVALGKDYPQPIVDLKKSRARALDAVRAL